MDQFGRLLDEYNDGLWRALRSVIPRIEDRIPITLNVVPTLLMSLVPFLFMAYLARREGTYPIRLLLLPTVITTTLWSSFTHYFPIPVMNVWNWGWCLSGIALVGKALEYALTPDGMLKPDEVRPKVTKGKSDAANGEVIISEPRMSWFAPWVVDVAELVHSMRGQRFKFGQGVYVPIDTRPQDRAAFLRVNALSFIQGFLVLDLLESILKLFPGVGSTTGGTMFYPELPVVERYAVSTFIHLVSGCALLAGFEMVYSLITLFAVGALDDSPAYWPPVLDRPWLSESMHELWSKRWHQILRQTFLVYGGYPGAKIGGSLGMLFGVFMASGLYHELGMYGMGRGFDTAPILFFSLQAPILLLERVWRKTTSRRVGGWPGRIWVYFVMFVLAQPMIDSWHRRGLGGGLVIPPFLSPARLLISLYTKS